MCRFVTVKDLIGNVHRARKFHFWTTPEIIVHDHLVIMFCRLQEGPKPKPVIIWNIYWDVVERIGKFDNLWLVHLDTAKEVLSVFTLSGNSNSYPVQLEQTKWSLRRKKLDTRPVQVVAWSGTVSMTT